MAFGICEKMKSRFNVLREGMRDFSREFSEKNHTAALVSRLRTVIRCEEKNVEKQYAILGRYYYDKLHTEADAGAMEIVEGLEKACAELNAAKLHLSRITGGEPELLKYEPVKTVESVTVEEEPCVPDAEPAADGENDSLPFE